MSHENYFKDVGFITFCMVLLPFNRYMFKVKNGSNRKICEICSKLTIDTPERRNDVQATAGGFEPTTT